jgi:predicted dehydrogenase
MTADRVRVAVVGTGRWAQVAHIPGWQRDSRADVVALADVNETALADAAGSFGVTRVTTDYRELLDDPGIDVIDVATGNFPGIEARIYGSEGAVIVRLVDEFGCCQTIRTATRSAVEFAEAEIPASYFPPGGNSGEPWEYLFYSGLVSDFITEILDTGRPAQGDFGQGALVQETINAFEQSFRSRAWVSFPLAEPSADGAPAPATGTAAP